MVLETGFFQIAEQALGITIPPRDRAEFLQDYLTDFVANDNDNDFLRFIVSTTQDEQK
jgi:hypothetical protein